MSKHLPSSAGGKDDKKGMVFTGGGTAGHVIPGLAVAGELLRDAPRPLFWIGGKGGMEEILVREKGYPYFGITCGKLRRYVSLQNFLDIAKIGIGFLQALTLLRKLKPSLVFSKGGYVSVPVVAAAALLKIPSFTHESDMDPGLATRLNARFVRVIFVSSEETKDYFPEEYQSKIVVSGNPIRPELLLGDEERGRRLLDFPGKKNPKFKPMLLILGGSQGSRQINDFVFECFDAIVSRWHVVHQTGVSESRKMTHENYRSFSYIGPELADYLTAADVVVSRAGANTLWELSALSKPSILIPLDLTGSRGDQLRNAKVFQDRGATITLTGSDACANELLKSLNRLFENEDLRKTMGAAAGGICKRNAASVIAGILKEFDGTL